MAVFLSTTNLHITSIAGLSWANLRIAFYSKRLQAAPFFSQEMWQCYSLQLTFTSPPPQVCLGLTYGLPFTANAFALRLILVKRYGSVSHYNLTSHHLHHKCGLGLPSQCLSQETPSQVCLEFTFALLFTASAPTLHFYLSREMAVFLTTTYLITATITSLSWVSFALLLTASAFTLRLNFCQEKW